MARLEFNEPLPYTRRDIRDNVYLNHCEICGGDIFLLCGHWYHEWFEYEADHSALPKQNGNGRKRKLAELEEARRIDRGDK